MKFTIISILVVVTACSCGTAGRNHSAEVHQQQQNQRSNDPDYSFRYAVHDSWTGDIKSQQETRHGDRVRGQYRMMESDGTERIVDYIADDQNGFNAIVRHQPPTAVLARVVPVAVPRVVSPLPVHATSNSRIVHYYDTPLVISNQVRHH